MQPSDLSILLTLKGRNFHTLRWMWHANRIRLPFHVVVADGEVNPIIANIMDNPSNFPDLSFEYHRYEDLSFSAYYRKCSDVISKIPSPYVMMSDNDDFLIPSGIFRSLSFLDKNPDYVGHRGCIGSFLTIRDNTLLPPNIVGPLEPLGTMYHCLNYADESATQRLLDAIKIYVPSFYQVYRTDRLRLIFDEIVSLDFSDLLIHERFCCFRTVTLGKVGIDCTSISYLRQHGTSSLCGGTMDWAHRVALNSFMADFQAMAKHLAMAAAMADEEEEIKTHVTLESAFLDLLGPSLTDHEEKLTFKRIMRKLLPDWLLKARRQYFPPIPPRPKRRCLIEILQKAGASKDYLDAFTLELQQIEETLEGTAFLDFLHSTVGKDLSVLY